MIKNQEYLSEKASYCLDLAKKLGATDSSVVVSNSISESVNFRNKKFTQETLQKIFKFQVSDKERKARSNIIIYNNDTKKDFIFSLEKALIKLLK